MWRGCGLNNFEFGHVLDVDAAEGATLIVDDDEVVDVV